MIEILDSYIYILIHPTVLVVSLSFVIIVYFYHIGGLSVKTTVAIHRCLLFDRMFQAIAIEGLRKRHSGRRLDGSNCE
jgi:hypothetical protein